MLSFARWSVAPARCRSLRQWRSRKVTYMRKAFASLSMFAVVAALSGLLLACGCESTPEAEPAAGDLPKDHPHAETPKDHPHADDK